MKEMNESAADAVQETQNFIEYRNGGIYNNACDIRQFHVLDEIENDSDSNDTEFTDDTDVPDEEVEKMLEEALAGKKRSASDANLG